MFASSDAAALYPNVNNMGLPAVTRFLKEHPSRLGIRTDCVMEAIDKAFTKTRVSIPMTQPLYLYAPRNRGNAMGPNHACDYVDVFVSELDRQLMSCPVPLLSSLLPRLLQGQYTSWTGRRDSTDTWTGRGDSTDTWIGRGDSTDNWTGRGDSTNTWTVHGSVMMDLPSFSTANTSNLSRTTSSRSTRLTSSGLFPTGKRQPTWRLSFLERWKDHHRCVQQTPFLFTTIQLPLASRV